MMSVIGDGFDVLERELRAAFAHLDQQDNGGWQTIQVQDHGRLDPEGDKAFVDQWSCGIPSAKKHLENALRRTRWRVVRGGVPRGKEGQDHA